jgi:hypothetical protein
MQIFSAGSGQTQENTSAFGWRFLPQSAECLAIWDILIAIQMNQGAGNHAKNKSFGNLPRFAEIELQAV